MYTNNLALLSQAEIDILVNFLSSKNLDSAETLSQESIDKLIAILNRSNSDLKEKAKAPCMELYCELDEKTNYILLFKMDKEKQLEPLFPASEEIDHIPHWGFCIAPNHFSAIARINNLEYSDETYAFICDRFAEIMFGNKDAEIPAIYLPNENH